MFRNKLFYNLIKTVIFVRLKFFFELGQNEIYGVVVKVFKMRK